MIIIITGLITEYNPFHNGHKYHLQKATQDTNADGIVCVMSGNFMQRGTPAIIDKWKRAEIAVRNGVDLVLELPLAYALSSAESFAFGSVSLLNSLGVIDNIYFGSEEGSIKSLDAVADVLAHEPDEYKLFLREALDKGLSFHSSREEAISKYLKFDVTDTISNSNNILGIEYIKALKRLNSTIQPVTLKREGSKYNDENLNNIFSSATSIRKHLKENSLESIKDIVPNYTYDILSELSASNYPFIFEEDMFKYIKYKLLTNSDALSNLPDISEGLDNKILKEVLSSDTLDELILKVKSKRYTYTRISRILTQSFLNLEKYDLSKLTKEEVSYARILAFNSKGRDILKKIKSNSDIKIITKMPRNNLCDMLEMDILGTKAYSILNSKVNPMDDYLKSPIIISK